MYLHIPRLFRRLVIRIKFYLKNSRSYICITGSLKTPVLDSRFAKDYPRGLGGDILSLLKPTISTFMFVDIIKGCIQFTVYLT